MMPSPQTPLSPPSAPLPTVIVPPASSRRTSVVPTASVPDVARSASVRESLADLASDPATAPSPPVALAAPVAVPSAAPVPNADLMSAQTSANEAVGAALSVFGVERRTPGANLPNTSLVGSLSGVMSLDGATSAAGTPASMPSATTEADPDPDEIRFQLAGFQSGTRRADQEN
jgi:hypothetical protein